MHSGFGKRNRERERKREKERDREREYARDVLPGIPRGSRPGAETTKAGQPGSWYLRKVFRVHSYRLCTQTPKYRNTLDTYITPVQRRYVFIRVIVEAVAVCLPPPPPRPKSFYSELYGHVLYYFALVPVFTVSTRSLQFNPGADLFYPPTSHRKACTHRILCFISAHPCNTYNILYLYTCNDRVMRVRYSDGDSRVGLGR